MRPVAKTLSAHINASFVYITCYVVGPENLMQIVQ